MRRALAISGKRYAGKDTLAAAIVAGAAARGVAVRTYAFADESKRMFADSQAERGVAIDVPRLRVDRAYKEAWRPQLTDFTMSALAADPRVFCRAVGDRIAADERAAVITDLRLRLEVAHLRPRFALRVVRVTRPDELRAASGWVRTPGVDDHPTETELDDPLWWDEEVFNDGPIAQLAVIVAARLTAWLG